ncbi:cupin domain-containing protein [Aurantiacibacter zhengii]|uniref:Cupin domain-containing protein n=1 Tax=Aurantiacibacter zhengii TaxID=2307003 RepID=A0A418NV66_9SPHN|nr:cupin domain-containing protein [Aurantiacibacter zhengii]RIV87976.1 cupin domain-containing protein [Aurantiacibacter zhengii]
MSEFKPNMIDAVPANAQSWRRVVTGEKIGRSLVSIDDGECPFQMSVEGAESIVVTDLWRTGVELGFAPDGPEMCSKPLVFGPPEGGTVAQMLEWPPDTQLFGTKDPAVAKNVTTHATATIDYVHIVSGEIYVMLDDDETLLSPGDTLVQRGTRHGWSNRGEKPCIMFVVMVSTSS